MSDKDKKLVYLLVEVNKEPTNEVEGDGWKPLAQHVAAEVQEVMGRHETDDGYAYGVVQALEIVPYGSHRKAMYPYVTTRPE